MKRSVWLLGHPVKHTLSPAMHNAAYARLGLDLIYLAADVPPEHLRAALEGLLRLGAVGVNLTIPHKQSVLELVTGLTDRARALGAVNCLKPGPDGWQGHNTDADGWLDSWTDEIGEELRNRPVLLMGRGGASLALQGVLAEQGARVRVLHREPLPELEPDTVVINATPVGTLSKESPVEWPELVPPGVVACDLVYNPIATRFLREAGGRGCRTLGGLGMLVHQARRAIEWWLDRPADCAEMMRLAAMRELT